MYDDHPDSFIEIELFSDYPFVAGDYVEGKIHLNYTPTNNQASQELISRLEGLLDKLYLKNHLAERQVYFASAMELAAVGHQCGTCRFGQDPKTSVLDLNCRTHDVDNLYVVDTSFFPSSDSTRVIFKLTWST